MRHRGSEGRAANVTTDQDGYAGRFEAPAGTPKEIVDKLNGAVNQALKEKAIIDMYHRIGVVIEGGSPEYMERLYIEDVQRWPKVVKNAGLVLE